MLQAHGLATTGVLILLKNLRDHDAQLSKFPGCSCPKAIDVLYNFKNMTSHE